MFYGAHVSSGGGIDTAIDRARERGANAVQVFTQSPRMWRHTDHKPETVAAFREKRERFGIESVVCHATYLINLGATDDVIYAKSVKALRETTATAERIGAEGVVFHVGSHLGRGFEQALHQVIPALQVACGERDDDPTWLLLENSAGHQGTMGVTIEELATIIDELGRPDRVGICLDSCHLFASGYEIRTVDGMNAILDEVDERIGLDRLRALHVNDAVDPLGSNRDRHANIGKGQLGKKLGVFLSHPKLQGLPAFLEVPGPDKDGPDAKEIRKARNLHKRWVATAG